MCSCFRNHREASSAGVEGRVAEVEANETVEGSGLSVLFRPKHGLRIFFFVRWEAVRVF